MSIQQKVQLVSKNRIWSEIRRYKVNDVVSYEEDSYQNISGKNSIPSELIDWIKIGGDSADGFIPLSGTIAGNPVTGDIEISDGSGIIVKDGGIFIGSEDRTVGITFPSEGDENVVFVTAAEGSKGFVGNSFFDKQDDPNAFAQMGDISGMSGDFIPNTEKGQANGVATLDINGKVPLTQINDALVGSVNYQGNYNASTNTPTLPTAAGNKGKYYVVTVSGTQQGLTLTNGDWIISNGVIWEKVDSNNDVTSVAGKTGSVTLLTSDITDLQGKLDLKANDADVVHKTGYLAELVTGQKTFNETVFMRGNSFGVSAILENSNTPATGLSWMEVRGPGINGDNCLFFGQYGDTAGVNRGKVLISNQSSSPTTATMSFATNKIERLILRTDGNSTFTGRVSGQPAVDSNDFVTLAQLNTKASLTQIGTAGSFSGAGTATTVFTVTIGSTQPNNTYKINATPTNVLSAALFYITNKTTTTFDVVYLAGLTGTVEFDWQLKP